MYKFVFLLLFSVIFAIAVSTHTRPIGFDINRGGPQGKVNCYNPEKEVILEEGEQIEFDIRIQRDFKSLFDCWCHKGKDTIYYEKVNFVSQDAVLQNWKTNTKPFETNMAGTWVCSFVVRQPDDWNGLGSYSRVYQDYVMTANCEMEIKIKRESSFPLTTLPPPPPPPSVSTFSPPTPFKSSEPTSNRRVPFDVTTDKQQLRADPKKIVLNIYYTDGGKVICQKSLDDHKYVIPGQTIQYVIETPAKMDSFICNNEHYQNIYNLQFIDDTTDKKRQQWHTEEIVMEPIMAGKSICKFTLMNQKREGNCELELKINASLWFTGLDPYQFIVHQDEFYTDYVYKYRHGEVLNVGCEFESKMADTTKKFEFHDFSNNQPKVENIYTTHQIKLGPEHKSSYFKCYIRDKSGLKSIRLNLTLDESAPSPITLNFIELNEWKWENKYYRNKIYSYTFTEGDAMFTCQLDNPTNNEEIYSFIYYLDSKIIRSVEVNVSRQQAKYFGHRFKLKKENKLIVCSATAVKGTKEAPMLQNKINLQYIPPPVLTISGPRNLAKGKYYPNNRTKIYDFYFNGGETVTLECALTDAKSYKNYLLSFYISKKASSETFDITRSTDSTSSPRKEVFVLKKDDEFIKCIAENMDPHSNLPKYLTNIVYLHQTPTEPGPPLFIRGPQKLVIGEYVSKNWTQLYNYNFNKDGEQVSLECALSDPEKYKNYVIHFCISEKINGCTSSEASPTAYKQTFILKKDHKVIQCTAKATTKSTIIPKYLYSRVYLHYRPEPTKTTGSEVNISIDGVPDVYKQQGQCKKDNDNLVTTCPYNFTDKAILNLTCVFSGGLEGEIYEITFGKENQNTKVQGGKISSKTQTEIFEIKERNRNITCTAKNTYDPLVNVPDTVYMCSIQFKYISPNSSPARNPSPSIDRSVEPSTDTPSTVNPDYLNKGFLWKWVGVGCTAVFTLFVAICCMWILCRHKKPPPDESNYANLTRGQNDYQAMPKPAPRTLKPGASQVDQKPNVGQRPQISQKPKATLENIYRDPKDSQDMSEALYAEPNRFIGESDHYAEPYVKSDNYARPYEKADNYAQPYAKSDNYSEPYAKTDNYAQPYAKPDNYSEPYVASSEGSYAELQVKPDLYATPIPKAQRPPKVKEDEYSNVFTGQYGNTKK